MSTKLIETVLELLSEKVKNIENENQHLKQQLVMLTERIALLESGCRNEEVQEEELEEERLTRAMARENAREKILAVVAPGTLVRVASRKEGSGIVIEPDRGEPIKIKYTLNRKSSGMTQWTSLERESLEMFDYYIFTSQVADQVIDLVFAREEVMAMGRAERHTPQFVRFSFTFSFEEGQLVSVVENGDKHINRIANVNGYALLR